MNMQAESLVKESRKINTIALHTFVNKYTFFVNIIHIKVYETQIKGCIFFAYVVYSYSQVKIRLHCGRL